MGEFVDRFDAVQKRGAAIGDALFDSPKKVIDTAGDHGLDLGAAEDLAKTAAHLYKSVQDTIKWDAVKQTLNLPKSIVDVARAFHPSPMGFHGRFDSVASAGTGMTTSLGGAAALASVAAPFVFPAAAVTVTSAGLVLFGVGAAIQISRIVENRRHAAGVAQFNQGRSSEQGPTQTALGVAGSILRGTGGAETGSLPVADCCDGTSSPKPAAGKGWRYPTIAV